MCQDKMVGNWQLWNMSRADQFFAYSFAYLKASIRNAEVDQVASGDFTWPDGVVCMWLFDHAIELFLKAAIIHRAGELVSGHNLRDLKRRYDEIYPEPELQWELPYYTDYSAIPEEEWAELQKNEPQPSILHRYPEDKLGKPWEGVHGFEREEHEGSAWGYYHELEDLRDRIIAT